MLKQALGNMGFGTLLVGIVLGAVLVSLVGLALLWGPQAPSAAASATEVEAPNCVVPIAMGQTPDDNMARNYFNLLDQIREWHTKGYPNRNDRLTRQATADLIAPIHCGYVALTQYLGRDDGTGKQYWTFIMADLSTIEVIRDSDFGEYRLRLGQEYFPDPADWDKAEIRIGHELGKASGFPK